MKASTLTGVVCCMVARSSDSLKPCLSGVSPLGQIHCCMPHPPKLEVFSGSPPNAKATPARTKHKLADLTRQRSSSTSDIYKVSATDTI